MMDDEVIVDIFEAADEFAAGNLSPITRLLPRIERGEFLEGVPILFYVVRSREIFDFLDGRGVNFLQKNELTGHNLLHDAILEDGSEIFEKVLSWYSSRGLVDDPDINGITPLSSALKFGKVERVERLIDSGANMLSVASNGLTPIKQALYCLEGEDVAISELDMLFKKGIAISSSEIQDLVKSAVFLGKKKVSKWIEDNVRLG
ncbi:hypothetical protein WT26_05485 [Burkholderia cepacia]|uniref:Uncharacterized protein n=2 Tax=Burkholderia cepacia complex TaxID=87882 RepID=A0A1B4PNM8_BURCE|nr:MULTISPECIES: hypothetical protein [Burkholderia cepacia complex]AOK15519.1 hypothetical protein WT26_05485 [Burkholderia cepacia]AOK22241.1 hypothetical protein WK67_05480 [Burkholderia ubonensis]